MKIEVKDLRRRARLGMLVGGDVFVCNGLFYMRVYHSGHNYNAISLAAGHLILLDPSIEVDKVEGKFVEE